MVKACGRRDFRAHLLGNTTCKQVVNSNPGRGLGRLVKIDRIGPDEYLSLREIEGVSEGWISKIRIWIKDYLKYVGWEADKEKTLEYLKELKYNTGVCFYRKKVYQIRRFLTYLNIEWAKDIKPPAEPYYSAKKIISNDIKQTISYFERHKFYKQFKAIILLGANSGLRAEELYQLNSIDIDIEKRAVCVNHNPSNGQTTKTGESRVVLFNQEAKDALSEYLAFFSNSANLKCLFSKTHIERAFRDASIKVKDLRKFFSQEWDRRLGPTGVKKRLMGHSIRGDVDLQHYSYLDTDDLKTIYDKVIPRYMITKE